MVTALAAKAPAIQIIDKQESSEVSRWHGDSPCGVAARSSNSFFRGPYQSLETTKYTAAPMPPATGMVSTQAVTILPATPQRTALSRRIAP